MFFNTKDTIPEGLGFSAFDITHLSWLFATLLLCVTGAIIYRKLPAQKQKAMRITVGIIIVFLEILKNIVMAALGEFGVGYLPLHLCGINILLIAFDIFKPTAIVRNFLYYFCIPGALLALLFPNWTTLPCLNFSHIHSFVIHAFLVMYPILLVSNGEAKPTLKAMPKSILLLVLIAIPIYFINLLCDTNFMFLMEPDKGNPLELFEKLLGSHLWGFPILLPAVMLIMYLPLFIISLFKKRAKAKNEIKEEVTV